MLRCCSVAAIRPTHIKMQRASAPQHTPASLGSATYCNTLQHTATHCNTLQQQNAASLGSATHTSESWLCNTLQHTATHYTILRHEDLQHEDSASLGTKLLGATTHCNTLQHAATHCTKQDSASLGSQLLGTTTHCNTLQHTATRCNTLQHTATNKIQQVSALSSLAQQDSLVGWLQIVGYLKS